MTPLEKDPQFAAALEECCRRVRQGESLHDCVASRPLEYREELVRLVPVVLQVGRVGRDPSAEFQARLEQRLLTSLEAERKKQRPRPTAFLGRFSLAGPTMRLAAMATVAMVVLVGGSLGAVQAAEDSLPDSPLYQVTAAREWAELALATTPDTQVTVQVNQVARRVRELERAVKAGRPRVVENLVNRASAAVERIIDRLLEEGATGRPRKARRVLAAIANVRTELGRLEAEASPSVLPFLQRLDGLLEEQERRLIEAGLSQQRPVRERSKPGANSQRRAAGQLSD